jgi:hypothetical protein
LSRTQFVKPQNIFKGGVGRRFDLWQGVVYGGSDNGGGAAE